VARPRQGGQVKGHQSIRLEPQAKEEIRRKFGSIQKFIDLMVKREISPDRNDPGKR
jgi:hypothetical protein